MKETPVAVVTGGSRGLGRAVARELAGWGYRLVLVARSRENLEAARAELAKECGLAGVDQPDIEAADLADAGAVREAAAAVTARHGRVDLLFNGAGISVPGSFELDEPVFSRLLAVNLRAPFLLMREIVPLMLRQGRGRIINVASRNGKVAVAGLGGYSASKFGLMGLGEAAYRELAAKGVSVTTICPGWVNTDMAAGEGASLPPEAMIQPEDIARTVRWLLSLGPSVRVMDVLLECAGDVERRASVELAKLYALRDRHREEFDNLVL